LSRTDERAILFDLARSKADRAYGALHERQDRTASLRDWARAGARTPQRPPFGALRSTAPGSARRDRSRDASSRLCAASNAWAYVSGRASGSPPKGN